MIMTLFNMFNVKSDLQRLILDKLALQLLKNLKEI